MIITSRENNICFAWYLYMTHNKKQIRYQKEFKRKLFFQKIPFVNLAFFFNLIFSFSLFFLIFCLCFSVGHVMCLRCGHHDFFVLFLIHLFIYFVFAFVHSLVIKPCQGEKKIISRFNEWIIKSTCCALREKNKAIWIHFYSFSLRMNELRRFFFPFSLSLKKIFLKYA